MDEIALLRRAYAESWASRDTNTKNAALLVNVRGEELMLAVNDMPPGVETHGRRWQPPLKARFVLHAETRVLLRAARAGLSTEGLVMVCPWSACGQCAAAMIEAGIRQVIVHGAAIERTPERWVDETETGNTMLREAGLKRTVIYGEIGQAKAWMDGVDWRP